MKSLTILSFLWKCFNLWRLPLGVCELCTLLAIFCSCKWIYMCNPQRYTSKISSYRIANKRVKNKYPAGTWRQANVVSASMRHHDVGHPISSDNGLISQKLLLKSEFYYPLHVVMGVAYSCLKYGVFIITWSDAMQICKQNCESQWSRKFTFLTDFCWE